MRHGFNVLPFAQDNRIIDAPRQRKQTKRYGNEDGDFELSDLDLEEDEEAPLPRRSSWTRVECFRVEKNLLIYGYVQFISCGVSSNIKQFLCARVPQEALEGIR